MKALALAASTLAATTKSANAAIPTSYIDIHKTTSFITTGSLETGYLFRIPASESTFAKNAPPKGPKWATHSSLTGGAHSNKDKDKKFSSYRLMLPPDADIFLCNEANGISDYKNPAGNSAAGMFDPDTLLSGYESSYILVARGGCTFEAKARSAQRLGAKGVIVRNTLDSRYGLMATDEDTVASAAIYTGTGPDWANTKWPVEKRDYECGTNKAAKGFGWRAEIEADKLDFSPSPYDGTQNNLLLTGLAVSGNLCAIQPNLEGDFSQLCPTERCLLTGRNATENGTVLEACCAWDSFVRMSTDGDNDGNAIPEEEEEDITIPALFVTMENGEELYDLVVDADANSQGGGESVQFLNVVPYGRWHPNVHYSSFLLWALAVFTLWVSSYESAKEYRNSWKKISKAVSDGVLVFQRNASNSNAGGGRQRAETEDTVDEDGDGDLHLAEEVEMTGTDDDGPAAIRGGGENEVPGSPSEGSFSIDDDGDHEDDFVGNPASPTPNVFNSRDTGPTYESVGEQQPPAAPRDTIAAALSPRSQQREQQQQQQEPQRVNLQSNNTGAAAAHNMELNAFHALFFIIAASCFLFVLFFFNLDKIVRVLYGLAGSVAMNQIIFYPLYAKLCSKFLGGEDGKMFSNAFGNLPGCRGVYFKWIDLLSSSTSYALGIAWIFVGLTRVQPMNTVYYWLIQDVMGVSFCVLILGLIHINTIMVASILLCLVFVYDVFYVFISPLFFGSSVMIDVATGAGGVDPSYCEKYPDDSACRGSLAPLPMLLAIPWFNDYRGGFTMIGLGDIILPGLLISFAARFDYARALVKKCTQTSSIPSGENVVDLGGEATIDPTSGTGILGGKTHYHLGRIYKALFKGYFGPLVIAYSIGLFIAYIAVWTMKRGQPALLYLVPACLGTMFFLGWRRRELSELWSGPKVMKKANRMVGIAGRIPEVRAAVAQQTGNTLAENATMV